MYKQKQNYRPFNYFLPGMFAIFTLLKVQMSMKSYRTSSVTHPYVAFNVKCRGSCKPERFHVSKYLGLEHLAFAPRSSETADQLVVDGASKNDKCVKCVF